MSGGTHIITKDGANIEIECQNCKASMSVPATSILGAEMVRQWPKVHKCPKTVKK